MYVKQVVGKNVAFAIALAPGARYLHYSCTGRKIVLDALTPKEAI
jgi:hypothetical protein